MLEGWSDAVRDPGLIGGLIGVRVKLNYWPLLAP